MDSLQRIGDWFAAEYRKNGLKILTGVKYTSMVASPILAAFGAVRAYKEIEKRKKERNVEELPLKETIGIVAKNEVQAAISMAGGIAASAKVDHDMKETINALTTTVMLGENKIRELKDAEKETVGKEKAEEIQKKADEKAIKNADTRGVVCDPVRGIYPCVDTKTGQIFPSSKAKIEDAFSMVKREVIYDTVFLGQFLEAAGGTWYLNNVEVCTAGSEYCWPESRNEIYEIEIRLMEDAYGQPMYVITYPENGGLAAVNDIPWKIEH